MYFLLFLFGIVLSLFVIFLLRTVQTVLLKPNKVIILERIIAELENADWEEKLRDGGDISLKTKIGPHEVWLFRTDKLGFSRYILSYHGSEMTISSDDVFRGLCSGSYYEYKYRIQKELARKLERLFNKANETEKRAYHQRLRKEEEKLRERKREAEELKKLKEFFKK